MPKVSICRGADIDFAFFVACPLICETTRFDIDMLTVISHVYNEELLIRFWLEHHLKIATFGIIVDYNSNDRTADIVRELAPNWEIVTTKNKFFDARRVDNEIMEIERSIHGWKIVLNVTEFLVDHQLNWRLSEIGDSSCVLSYSSVVVCDPVGQERGTLNVSAPLLDQCHWGFVDNPCRSARFLHNMPDGRYSTGRHSTTHDSTPVTDAFIAWFGWAPWPEAIMRKLQIQTRIPEHDKMQGLGAQHIVSSTQLYDRHEATAIRAYDLESDPRWCRARWGTFAPPPFRK